MLWRRASLVALLLGHARGGQGLERLVGSAVGRRGGFEALGDGRLRGTAGVARAGGSGRSRRRLGDGGAVVVEVVVGLFRVQGAAEHGARDVGRRRGQLGFLVRHRRRQRRARRVFLRAVLLLDGGARLSHAPPLELQDVPQLDDVVVGVGDARLPTFAHADEGEVGQLPAEGGERGVVEIHREDGGLEAMAVVDDDAPTDGFAGESLCSRWERGGNNVTG